LCEAHGVPLPALKSIVKALDKECDAVADRVKSQLQKINPSNTSSKLRTRPHASPQKSPSKSAMKSKLLDRTPVKPLTLKRAVVFSNDILDDSDDIPFPETPSKKRRVQSPSKPGPSVSPTKRVTASQGATSSTAAFELAMKGVSTPRHERQKSIGGTHSPLPGPSTPRRTRTRTSRPAEEPEAMEVDEQPVEAPEPPVRRRFRPVFLDQQQWCSRDPKLSKTWDAAVEHRTQMMRLYLHPFEQCRTVVTS
jgi:hypothetical protein